MKWAVLATGPSLTVEQVEAVKGKRRVVAVSDAYKLAPWCDAIASSDGAWWRVHEQQVSQIPCRKFHAGQPNAPMSGHLLPIDGCSTNLNSGALGILVAKSLGATDILLLGFDMTNERGHHFFGEHEHGLNKTPEQRYDIFREQFRILAAQLAWDRVRVVNCAPGSKLFNFPMSTLEKELQCAAI